MRSTTLREPGTGTGRTILYRDTGPGLEDNCVHVMEESMFVHQQGRTVSAGDSCKD
jgi:hypothetical protein